MPGAFLPGIGYAGPMPRESVVVTVEGNEYLLDVDALTSNYRCIYGCGCQGITPIEGEGPGRHRPADPAVAGCCRTMPHFAFATSEVPAGEEAVLDSPLRIAPYVAALTPAEAQHHERIESGDWFVEDVDGDSVRAHHTGVGGNCIFLNTEMPDGRTGCSLVHVARRLGVDPRETRPHACHTTPAGVFDAGDTPDGAGTRLLVTLRPPWFGWFAPTGYFCTSDPAAYSGAEPVFRSMRSEFSMLVGEDVYAELSAALEQVWSERGARLRGTWGRPVALGMPTWARDTAPESGDGAAGA